MYEPLHAGGLDSQLPSKWSSEAKGKHLERHRVPENKLDVYSDLNTDPRGGTLTVKRWGCQHFEKILSLKNTWKQIPPPKKYLINIQ